MNLRKLASAISALALTGGAALVAAAPAMATGNNGCPATILTSTTGVTTSGDATATVTGNGLRFKTPVRASRVRFEQPYSNAFANLTGLSYRTFTHSDGDRGFATVAARVGLDTNGDGSTDVTLVYEPYFNATVTEGGWQSWNTIAAGDGKWWWAEEPGNPQTPRPWSYWQATHSDAVLTFINVGMGTWNEGADARVNDLRVSVKQNGCKRFEWKKPSTPTATPTTTPSATVSPSATASPSVTVTPTDPPVSNPPTGKPSTSGGPIEPGVGFSPSQAAGGGGGELALTGANALGLGGGALLLISVGGLLFVLARRRRARFEV